MFHRLFISLLTLVGAALGGAVAGPGPALAQGSDVDLAVGIEVPDSASNRAASGPTITVTNGGADPAYTVEVVIEADNVEFDDEIAEPPIGGVALRDSKLIWSIAQLPGESAYQYTANIASTTETLQVRQYVATVSSRNVLEPEHDNRAEVWQVKVSNNSFRAPTPGYAVSVAVDNRFPPSGGSVTFTIKGSIPTADARQALRNAQVALELPAGLTFSTPTPPAGTSYDSSTGIWTIGGWNPGTATTYSLMLTATRAANTVLNEQCVTAEISAKPPESTDETADNRTTFCLGRPPDGPVLFRSGEVELWTPYPCVGKTTHPCTTADTVEVATVATIEKWGSGQIIKSSPEKVNVFIQVDPVRGRIVDTHAQSVSTVSWQTKKTETDHGHTTVLVPGVQIGYKREQFNAEIANWASIVRTVSVSGVINPPASDQTCDAGDPSPPCAPGRMKVRLPSTGNTFFDPNPSSERNPFNLTAQSTTFSKYFAEFEKLGTYVVDFKADVTHTNTNVYSGTNRSIFHVGPVAELEVRDAGPSPGATPSQRAFTIMAVNNGPDAAPAAQVTVDLQGANVSQVIASQGSYGNGVWTIGALPINDPTIAPTLTLITDAPADTPITATITNTQDYEVCIDSSGNDVDVAAESACTSTTGNTWHTAKHYDYISDNNTATVTAQAGAASQTPTAAITVGWTAQPGASTYQVWRQGSPWTLIAEVPASQTRYTDTTAEPGRAYLYTVRALDAQGIPMSSETVVAAAPRPPTGSVTRSPVGGVPNGPTRLRAVARGPTRILLYWSGPRSLYGRAVTSYEVEVSHDLDHWTTVAPYVEAAGPTRSGQQVATKYTHTGLRPATTYYYRVYAHNRYGRSLASPVVGAITDDPQVLTGFLENPAPGSFQSGIGVIHGWECDADEVVIQINGTPSPAVYGTPRPDTLEACGDTDNGFELLLNWNEWGDGRHEVVVLVDGTELGRAIVIVTTLGAPFVSGLSGTCDVADFPTPGERVTLVWQEARQNFVITDGRTPPTFSSTGSSPVPGFLENPAPNTFQSGIGPLTGWVCEAEDVTLKINGQSYPAPYGLERPDTLGPCGDTDNGFGTVFNWNVLGSGEHTVETIADGVVLDRATVWVRTLGEEFVRDVAGTCEVPDFPAAGDTVTLVWQEAQQNFVITNVE